MHVLVMGAGGVGGYLGALLARAGHTVTVIARGEHLQAIRSRGLRIESAVETPFTASVRADENASSPVDLILFTVKSYDTAHAIDVIRPSLGPNTTVLPLQNGIGSGDVLAGAFGWEHVLEGVVYIESHVRAPGIIEQAGGPRRVIIGRRTGNREQEQALLETVRRAGWEAELSDNILNALWTKLSFIGPFAALNTITGLKGPQLCSVRDTTDLARAVISEYVAVGNAEGAELLDSTIEDCLYRLQTFPGTSSMCRDRFAGRRIEIDALVGEVLRRGEALGIPTPNAKALFALLAPMRNGDAVPSA